MDMNFCVPCLLGLEGLIADELREMGALNVNAENGRVLFSVECTEVTDPENRL